MMKPLAHYPTHVFDCDGVLVDSARVKSGAFYEAALPYGEDAAQRMVEIHRSAGSISREARWRAFFAYVIGRPAGPGELREVLDRCTELVRQGTREAPLLPGVEAYLQALGRERCVVVSGIEQRELQAILCEHGIEGCFSRVWGGPRTKAVLLRDVICTGELALPAVYYGDVEADYLDARNAGLDFVWVSGCSEWDGLRQIQDFRELVAA